MSAPMTRAEWDQLDSNRAHPCPDCKRNTTHPTPGCGCPPNANGYGTRHINAYHHTCPRKHDWYMYANMTACRRCGQAAAGPYTTEFCE